VLIAALLIGILIIAQGLLGLAMPNLFVGLVRAFQETPIIYAAALIRFIFGTVLFFAAPASRAPVALRGLGALIALGGLLTPLIGVPFARVVLGWWSEGGATVVRMWAAAALGLGAFVLYATAPGRRAA
jgi:uncharacterized membrane protein